MIYAQVIQDQPERTGWAEVGQLQRALAFAPEGWGGLTIEGGGDAGGGGDNGGGPGAGEGGDAGGGAGGAGDTGTGVGTGTPTGTPAAPDLTTAEGLMASLPADLRGHSALAKTANLEGLARSFIAAQQMIGGDPSNLVTMPNLTDADAVKSMQHRLGLPKEQGEAYDVKPATAPQDFMKADGDFAKGFAKAAFEAGLMPAAANGIYNHMVETFNTMFTEGQANLNDTAKKNIDTLKVTWGAAYDQNVAAAVFAVEKLGGPPLAQAIENGRLGTDPHLMEAFSKIGKILGEETGATLAGVEGTVNAFNQTATPAEDINKGRELLQKAMNEKNPAERQRINKVAQEYFARAHPGNVATT